MMGRFHEKNLGKHQIIKSTESQKVIEIVLRENRCEVLSD